MPETRIDFQVQSLYPTVPQTDIAKGEGPNGEKVETNLKLVEPVTAVGGQVSAIHEVTKKLSVLAALSGGWGIGSRFKLAYGSLGIGVEKSFPEGNKTWSLATLLGYRGNFILDADGTTHGPFVSVEMNGRVTPSWGLVGGMGVYAPGWNALEQFYYIGARVIFGSTGNNGGSSQ